MPLFLINLLQSQTVRDVVMGWVRHALVGLGAVAITWLVAHGADQGNATTMVSELADAAMIGTGLGWSMLDKTKAATQKKVIAQLAAEHAVTPSDAKAAALAHLTGGTA